MASPRRHEPLKPSGAKRDQPKRWPDLVHRVGLHWRDRLLRPPDHGVSLPTPEPGCRHAKEEEEEGSRRSATGRGQPRDAADRLHAALWPHSQCRRRHDLVPVRSLFVPRGLLCKARTCPYRKHSAVFAALLSSAPGGNFQELVRTQGSIRCIVCKADSVQEVYFRLDHIRHPSCCPST